MRRVRWALVAAVLLLSSGDALPGRRAAAGGSSCPRLVIWAWERPERLGFLDPDRVEVAVLAATLDLRGDAVGVAPRRQPLEVPQGTRVTAVVRIQSGRPPSPAYSDVQGSAVVGELLDVVARTGARALQVDFDARASERDFYRRILHGLRERLPGGVRLSMTALASWCQDDPWVEDLPVDEAIPMLFRMGPEAARIRARLREGRAFSLPVCRHGVGLSVDEPWVALETRYWVFSPDGWTEAGVRAVLRRLREEEP